MRICSVVTLSILFGTTYSTRILGFFPVPSISHQLVFRQLMLELNRRGHDITVVTPDPVGGEITNYTEIDMHHLYQFAQQDLDLFRPMTPEEFFWKANSILLAVLDAEFSHPSIRQLLEHGQFDLIFVEFLMFPSLCSLSHHFRAPFIGIASLDLSPALHHLVGNPYHPGYYPDIFLPETDRKDFYTRLRSTLNFLFVSLTYKYYWTPQHDILAKKHFGLDTPYVGDLEKNVSMVFAYTDFRSSYPFPMVPAYLQINGGRPIHMVEQHSLPQSVICARILGFFPIPSISHQVVFRRLMNELCKRGHHVTVATPDPVGIRNENYTEIDLHFIYKPFRDAFPETDKTIPEKAMWHAYEVLANLVDLELSHDPVKRLLREGSFDLVFVEILLLPAVTALSHHFKAPFIGIASLDVFAPTHELIGNPFNPAYYPEMILPYTNKKDFYARFRSTLTYLFWKLAYKYRWLPKHDAIAKKHFGPDTPYIEDVEKNVSMIFANTDFRTTYPFPMVPAYLQIGGGRPIHMVEGKPLPQVRGIRILAVLPTPSFSHHVFYNRYLLELHKTGHDITVATPYPVDDTNLTGYRQIDFSHLKSYWNEVWHGKFEKENVKSSILEMGLLVSEIIFEIHRVYSTHPEMRAIVEKGEMFDLFVSEWSLVNPSCPYMRHANYSIGITSFDLEPLSSYEMGGTASPAYVPSTNAPYSDRMTLFQRLSNTCSYITFFLFKLYFNLIFDSKNREYFGPDVPSMFALEKKVDLILTNSHFTAQTPKPFATNVIPIGGPPFHLQGYDLRPLPQDLQRFLDDAKEGVIYFSLGSNVKSEAMPENKREVFLRAFSRVKQKVLWKWEADVLPGKPDNVKIAKWLPQTEILAHPNVRAFITQGGLQSVSEAVYYTKPMIVIPFFADQELNAKKLVSERVGIRIEYENLELDSFMAALHEILNDSGYKERIIKYSALTQDQPQSPLERAVWWTEYVIRHKGAKHLRSAAVDMPWYQYFLLDVFAFILAVLSITCYALYKIFSLVLRLLFGKNKAKKE